jgi:transposase
MLKAQLYELIKLNKPKQKCYVIAQILAEEGHTVLRRPPYHPDINPIELIWADVK